MSIFAMNFCNVAMDKHYDASILKRVEMLVGESDWQGLVDYVDGLSNARFRTAGYMIGERIVPKLDETAVWQLTMRLTEHNSKAFLVTMMKAVALRLRQGTMLLRSSGSRAFLAMVRENEVDRQKVMTELLPVVENHEDVGWLLGKLGVEEGRERLVALLRVPTTAAAFTLFRTLHYIEHDRVMLVRTARFLMQRGDAMGFNLASLVRTYYGLDEVTGTFSLHIEPYELARLANSYDAFRRAMQL